MLSSVPVWQTAPVCHELLQAHKVFLNHTAHIFSMQLCEGFGNESDVIGCVCWFYVVVVGRSHSWHHITASPSQQLPGCWSVSVWFSETDRQNIILQKRVSVCITDKTCMSSIILSEKSWLIKPQYVLKSNINLTTKRLGKGFLPLLNIFSLLFFKPKRISNQLTCEKKGPTEEDGEMATRRKR